MKRSDKKKDQSLLSLTGFSQRCPGGGKVTSSAARGQLLNLSTEERHKTISEMDEKGQLLALNPQKPQRR